MVKYKYDIKMEAFRRVDNRGKPLYINVNEAQQIVSMLDLGNSVPDICGRVNLNSPRASVTTIKSFIRNYNDGNIEIPKDAPAPTNVYDSMNNEVRFNELEERVRILEQKMDKCLENNCECDCENHENLVSKVKTWWIK